jgi:hypothetical protein
MDPNENLAEQRRLLESYGPGQDEYLDHVEEISRLAQDMDKWLSSGGFLPDAWTHAGGKA